MASLDVLLVDNSAGGLPFSPQGDEAKLACILASVAWYQGTDVYPGASAAEFAGIHLARQAGRNPTKAPAGTAGYDYLDGNTRISVKSRNLDAFWKKGRWKSGDIGWAQKTRNNLDQLEYWYVGPGVAVRVGQFSHPLPAGKISSKGIESHPDKKMFSQADLMTAAELCNRLAGVTYRQALADPSLVALLVGHNLCPVKVQ